MKKQSKLIIIFFISVVNTFSLMPSAIKRTDLAKDQKNILKGILVGAGIGTLGLTALSVFQYLYNKGSNNKSFIQNFIIGGITGGFSGGIIKKIIFTESEKKRIQLEQLEEEKRKEEEALQKKICEEKIVRQKAMREKINSPQELQKRKEKILQQEKELDKRIQLRTKYDSATMTYKDISRPEEYDQIAELKLKDTTCFYCDKKIKRDDGIILQTKDFSEQLVGKLLYEYKIKNSIPDKTTEQKNQEAAEQAAQNIYKRYILGNTLPQKIKESVIKNKELKMEHYEEKYKAMKDSHNKFLEAVEIRINKKDRSEDWTIDVPHELYKQELKKIELAEQGINEEKILEEIANDLYKTHILGEEGKIRTIRIGEESKNKAIQKKYLEVQIDYGDYEEYYKTVNIKDVNGKDFKVDVSNSDYLKKLNEKNIFPIKEKNKMDILLSLDIKTLPRARLFNKEISWNNVYSFLVNLTKVTNNYLKFLNFTKNFSTLFAKSIGMFFLNKIFSGNKYSGFNFTQDFIKINNIAEQKKFLKIVAFDICYGIYSGTCGQRKLEAFQYTNNTCKGNCRLNEIVNHDEASGPFTFLEIIFMDLKDQYEAMQQDSTNYYNPDEHFLLSEILKSFGFEINPTMTNQETLKNIFQEKYYLFNTYLFNDNIKIPETNIDDINAKTNKF